MSFNNCFRPHHHGHQSCYQYGLTGSQLPHGFLTGAPRSTPDARTLPPRYVQNKFVIVKYELLSVTMTVQQFRKFARVLL